MSDNNAVRAYRVARAYLDKVRNRIDDALDERLTDAEAELRGEADTPPPGAPRTAAGSRPAAPRASGSVDDTSADAMFRRAQEKIRAARSEIDAREATVRDDGATPPPISNPQPQSASDPNASDFRVLGIPFDADFSAVQSAYEKIARRCDPRRFPDGSREQQDAQLILERVNVAYENLRKRLDPTESRFARLEFDAGAANPSAPVDPPTAPSLPPEIN